MKSIALLLETFLTYVSGALLGLEAGKVTLIDVAGSKALSHLFFANKLANGATCDLTSAEVQAHDGIALCHCR